jgi:hypothetical protein
VDERELIHRFSGAASIGIERDQAEPVIPEIKEQS